MSRLFLFLLLSSPFSLLPCFSQEQDLSSPSTSSCNIELYFPPPTPGPGVPLFPNIDSVYAVCHKGSVADDLLPKLVEAYCGPPTPSVEGAFSVEDCNGLPFLQSVTFAEMPAVSDGHFSSYIASRFPGVPSSSLLAAALPALDFLLVPGTLFTSVYGFDPSPEYFLAGADVSAATTSICLRWFPIQIHPELERLNNDCRRDVFARLSPTHLLLSSSHLSIQRLSSYLPRTSSTAYSRSAPSAADPLCFPPLTLGCIMYAHGTDKGWMHGYYRTYSKHLGEYRERDGLRFLEIGVFEGASIGVWEDYFDGEGNKYYGIGYSGEDRSGDYFAADETDFAFQYSPQTTLFRGDQSDGAFLASMLAESGGDFDIIVDDGSHDPAHMLFTFDILFPHLQPGGLYIFEDVETSYWNQEGASLYGRTLEQPLGIGTTKSVVERFKGVVDDGRNMNGLFVGPKSREARDEARDEVRTKMKWEDDIAEVSFAQNIIVVRKKEAADDWFYNAVRQGRYIHRSLTL